MAILGIFMYKSRIILRAESYLLRAESYSDSQKHESSCLLSDLFWYISSELLELQKIDLNLFISIFEELSAGTGIFQIR